MTQTSRRVGGRSPSDATVTCAFRAAAIGALREHGRIAWCGAIGQYNNLRNPPAAPRNRFDLVERCLRLEGFLVRNHLDAGEEFELFLIPHIQTGKVCPAPSNQATPGHHTPKIRQTRGRARLGDRLAQVSCRGG